MRRVAAILILGMLSCSSALAAMRCGNRIVTEGDSRAEVLARCGEPTEVIQLPAELRPPVLWVRGRPYYVGEGYLEVRVESWVYNLGPNQFMRRLRFENGVVREIETLGYGYL